MKNNNHKNWIALGVFFTSVFLLHSSELQAKDMQEKVKKTIEDVSDFLKKEVDKVAGSVEAVQEYLDHYSWKGVIQDHTTSGVATVGHLKLNGHSKAVVVHAGDKIEGELHCYLDSDKCSKLSFYRVIVGLKGAGPQVSLCNYLGAVAGKSVEKFTLKAPQAAGVYQVRFRVVESFSESDAFGEWADEKGQEPEASTTIGVIIVK